MITKIISGGETGVDRGALDFAIKNGIAHGGFCPKGRLSESGRIPDKYQLEETSSTGWGSCMVKNVQHSDGTLIITRGAPSGGTGDTEDIARSCGKPKQVINLKRKLEPEKFVAWVRDQRIATLFVAGPRESRQSGIRKAAMHTLDILIRELRAAEGIG